MTREDIIRMAREAGFDFYETMHVWTTPTEGVPYPEGVYTENLEHFAALVAAAERKEFAQACIEVGATKANSDDGFDMADSCADAILARKEK